MIRLQRRTSIFFLLFALILAVGLGIRLLGLTKLPVFADEAIYIRWSQVMRAESSLRFLPLTDGKQPLFMWVLIPFLKIFSDPLFAGRFLSSICGAATLVGIGSISFILFKSRKAALLSSLLYALSPFSFFFDRMALVDSMLTMFSVWFLLFLVLSVKYIRWDFSMLAGFALGGALLTKSPGIFFLLLIPTSLFLTTFPSDQKKRTMHFVKIAGLWLTTIVIGYGLSQILRLGPDYQQISSRNLDYVFPLTHILENPRDPFVFLIDRALEWLFFMGPLWFPILSLFGIFKLLKKDSGKVMFLIAFWVGPFLVSAMYAKVFTERYILYTLPPLFVLAGAAILHTKHLQKLVVVLVALFLVSASVFDFLLITNPEAAPIPRSERSGYLEEWTAGTGIKEVADYLRNEHINNPNEHIVVGTEGYFGTLPDGLQIYLEKVPNVTIIGTGLNFTDVPDSLKASKNAGNKTYFVANSSRLKLTKDFSAYGLTVVKSFNKADRPNNIREYVQYGAHDIFYLFQVN